MAPGFLTRLEMDNGDRVVTFFSGPVARERLVTLDGGRSRLVWTIDILPNERAPAIGGMMEQALPVMKKTLEAA